jgi:hypothetical protein
MDRRIKKWSLSRPPFIQLLVKNMTKMTLPDGRVVELAVRETLSAKHFRKYEHFLARADNGTYEVNPREFKEPLRPMKAKTFVNCLQEARRAYMLYGGLEEYRSHIIPITLNLTLLKFKETACGTVIIKNDYKDQLKTFYGNPETATGAPPVLSAHEVPKPPAWDVTVSWDNLYERENKLELIAKHHAEDVTWRYTNTIKFRCTTPQEEQEAIATLKQMGFQTQVQNGCVLYF